MVFLVFAAAVFLPSPVCFLPQQNEALAQTPGTGKYGLDKLSGVNLPSTDPDKFIIQIINAVTVMLGVILIAVLVYAGSLYLTAAGNEEKTKSAKNIITYAIIGMVVVAAARIIATFVIEALTKK